MKRINYVESNVGLCLLRGIYSTLVLQILFILYLINLPIISPLNQCVVSPLIDNLIPHRSHVLILSWKPSQFETSSRDMDTLRNTVAYYKKLRNNEIDHGDILAFRLAAIMRYIRSWWWC